MAEPAGRGFRAGVARFTGVSQSPRDDVALAFVVALVAGILWWQALKVPPPFFDPLGSAAVPKAIALCLFVLAAIIVLRAALAWPWPPRARPEDYRPRPDIALGIFLLATAYVGALSLRIISFELATILFLIAAAALLGRMGKATLVAGVISAVALGVGATWLFTRFFFIDLPR